MSEQPQPADVAKEYRRLFRELEVAKEWDKQLDAACNRISAHRDQYEALVLKVPNGLPWFGVALIHFMEGDLDFATHLHNGDSLKRRTVNEPAGRPVSGQPPFTWEESALDSLKYDGWTKWKDWSLPGLLYELEDYNGWGTRARGVHTPYLWSGSQHYKRGKYISDGVWSPTAISKQLGAAVVLHELCSRGIAVFRAVRVEVGA